MGYKDECFTWDAETILRKMLDTDFNKSQDNSYERAKVIGWIKPKRTPKTMKEHFPILSNIMKKVT